MAEDALARAREIAARLAGGLASSSLGKRKADGEDGGTVGGPGLGSTSSRKIYIPVKENSDINYLGLLIGPKGATQKQMSERTGARIVIRGRGASRDGGPSNTGHPDDQDELHVYLEGQEENVASAAKEIEEIFNNPEHAQRLKAQQLGFNPNSDSGGADMSVYGAGSDASTTELELQVPNTMVGLVIGKGGENIVRIQNQLGIHAQIAKEHEMLPGETTRRIVLKGAADKIAEGKARIEETIAAQIAKVSGVSGSVGGMGGGGFGNGTLAGGAGGSSGDVKDMTHHAFLVKLPIPNDKVGIIIGKGGITIKGIQERSRADVQIPQAADANDPAVRTLSIGADSKEAVDAAQMEIFMTLQQHQQQKETVDVHALQVVVPNDRVGLIIGKGGVNVKEIQNRLGVRVQIPQEPDAGTMPPVRTISISGPAAVQPIAKQEIEALAAGGAGGGMNKSAGAGMNMNMGIYGAGAGMYGGVGGGAPSPYGAPVGGMWGAAAAPYGVNMGAMGGMGAATAAAGYYGAAAAGGGGYGQPTGAAGTAYGGYGGGMTGAAGYYGGAAAGMYGQQQQQAQQYGAAYGASTATTTAAASSSTTTTAAAVDPNDPTAYYEQFWQYCTYYGEKAAREFYGAWSPPEGTPPPPGIVVAPDSNSSQAPAPPPAETATTTAASSAQQQPPLPTETSTGGGDAGAPPLPTEAQQPPPVDNAATTTTTTTTNTTTTATTTTNTWTYYCTVTYVLLYKEYTLRIP